MRDRLVDRALFLAVFLVAVAVTTAVILVVAGHRPAHGRLVVRPAATASPAR